MVVAVVERGSLLEVRRHVIGRHVLNDSRPAGTVNGFSADYSSFK